MVVYGSWDYLSLYIAVDFAFVLCCWIWLDFVSLVPLVFNLIWTLSFDVMFTVFTVDAWLFYSAL